MWSIQPLSDLLLHPVDIVIKSVAFLTMITWKVVYNIYCPIWLPMAGAVMIAAHFVYIIFVLRNDLFSDEVTLADSEASSDEKSPSASTVTVEFPDGIRKPRRKGKKIRFESPGLDGDQMKQILVPAKIFKKRNRNSRNIKFKDFDLFAPHNQEKGKSGVPSLWDYNPRCLPREFYDVEPESYMVDPSQPNFCHFTKKILNRICSMLRPLDFVELSLACRFLHWRMFTFCTCYAPYTIRMEIIDDRVKEGLGKYQAAPKMFYRKKGEYGGLFVLQPSCLKRPFFFETLELSLELRVEFYPQALKLALPVRKHANRVKLIHYKAKPRDVYYTVHMAGLMEELKVNSFRFWFDFHTLGAHYFLTGLDSQATSGLWHIIPYFRQMDEACVSYMSSNKKLLLMNRFGIYYDPDNLQMADAMAKIADGDCGLEFHVYMGLDYDKRMLVPLLNMQEGHEYYSERHGHIWKFYEEDQCGNGLTVKVYKKDDEAVVLFGRSKTFGKNQRHYHRLCRIAMRDPAEDDSDEEDYPDDYDDDQDEKCWRMETAVEATEDKKEKRDEKWWWW